MRKKLFAVIMSAMMMITFMPTMAFASVTIGNNTWADDYTSVSYPVAGGSNTSTALRWAEYLTYSSNWVSVDVAGTPTTSPSDKKIDKFTGYVKAIATASDGATAKYVDLNFASVTRLNNVDKALISEMKYDYAMDVFKNFQDEQKVTGITLNIPSYVQSPDAYDESLTLTNDQFQNGKSLENAGEASASPAFTKTHYTVNVDVTGYDKDKKYEKQEVTLSFQVKKNGPNNADYAHLVGSIKPMKITVLGKEADVKETKYKVVDGLSANAVTEAGDNEEIKVYYDGAAHEVQQVEMPGVTSSYEIWDAEKVAFVEVSGAATVKDVDKYTFRATATDGKKKDTKTFYVEVVKSGPIVYKFDNIDVYNINNIPYRVDDLRTTYISGSGKNAFYVGSNYNPVDFVSVSDQGTNNQKKAFDKAKEADKDAIKAYFNDYFEIKQTETTYDKGIFTAKIADKDLSALTDAETKELKAKHKALLGNYTGTPSVALNTEATFYVKDEVTFTKAPLNKTFKAKNGKLAKKRTFKVTAKAASGAKVTYKIANGGSRIVINKNTGKVTLKKGLKKRTYNIKITASAGTYIGTDKSFTCKIKVK